MRGQLGNHLKLVSLGNLLQYVLFARSIVGDLFKADIGEAAERVQYLFDRLIVQLSDKIDLISTVTVPIVEDARLLPLI